MYTYQYKIENIFYKIDYDIIKVMTNLKESDDLNFVNAIVTYDPAFLSPNNANHIFDAISQIFESEERKIINNERDEPIYRLNRKTIVYVDKNIDRAVIPKIWGNNVSIFEFPEKMLEIKTNLENKLNFKFNICLANYYNSGKNSIGWHSDNEEKGSTSCIASISLGAEREFMFRTKSSKEIYKTLILNHGSLIMMGPGCQENYEHSLPVNKNCKQPRLNLTFRLFDNERYKNH